MQVILSITYTGSLDKSDPFVLLEKSVPDQNLVYQKFQFIKNLIY
jgi:hypothetical protein